MLLPDIKTVEHAAQVIQPLLKATPVLQSQSINELVGYQVYFKCENLQRTGAFKIRGAAYAVSHLCSNEKIKGVITHSSGNHAAALACAAKANELACEIVMPNDASQYKQQAVRKYGANLTLCAPGMPARQSAAEDLLTRLPGFQLVHPYDDYHVIAGQATATLEFIQQTRNLQTVILPIGGGGLISGASIVLRAMAPGTALIGVEPEVVDEARRSILDGQRHPATGKQTIADGLQAGVGRLNFSEIQRGVQEIVTVTEPQIQDALRLIVERLKIVIEPSSAVPLAALMSGSIRPPGERIGIILSGGNIDIDTLANII